MLINNKNTIIVLRAQDRAKCLETLLTSNGYNVIIEPVIKIIPYKYIPTDFKKVDAIMLTSVNSVKILNKHINKNIIINIKAYCVGEITEKWAEISGFNCIKTNAYSGKTLEKAILKDAMHFKEKIIIYGGESIAHNPIPTFEKKGINYERIILYKTSPIKKLSNNCKHHILNNKASHILFYSPNIAKAFLTLTKDYDFSGITAVCLGKKIENILEKYNWKKILTMNNIKPKDFANSIIKDNM